MALLNDVRQLVRDQLLPSRGLRLITAAAEVDVAARGEGVRLDALRSIGSIAVVVHPYVVEGMTEAVLHHPARVRRQRSAGAAAVERVLKAGGGRCGFRCRLALHRLLAIVASAAAR